MNAVTDRLHHLLIVPAVVIVAGVIQMTIWSFDREPPFEILSTHTAKAKAGDAVVLRAAVRRDLSRRCSAHFGRAVIDSSGARYDFEGSQFAAASTIEMIDRYTPGEMLVALDVPSAAQPGPASLVTTLRYACNPTHMLVPIDLVTVIPFLIEP
jgi:hypothetical protein